MAGMPWARIVVLAATLARSTLGDNATTDKAPPCPYTAICTDNTCEGKSCLHILSVKIADTSKAEKDKAGSKGNKSCEAVGLLFEQCKECQPSSTGCGAERLFSATQAVEGPLPGDVGKIGVASLTGLAVASALAAAALALARSRRAAAEPQLLREVSDAAEGAECGATEERA